MKTANQMEEMFQSLYGASEQQSMSYFGQPDIRFQHLNAYKKNGLWLVLMYSALEQNEERENVVGAVFFSERLELLWSKNVNLVSETVFDRMGKQKLGELVSGLGLPHGHGGSGISFLIYLTDEGKFLMIYYSGEEIKKVEKASLNEIFAAEFAK